MSEIKITELDEISQADSLDLLEIVDVDDTTDGPDGTSKSVKVQNLGSRTIEYWQSGTIYNEGDPVLYSTDDLPADKYRLFLTNSNHPNAGQSTFDSNFFDEVLGFEGDDSISGNGSSSSPFSVVIGSTTYTAVNDRTDTQFTDAAAAITEALTGHWETFTSTTTRDNFPSNRRKEGMIAKVIGGSTYMLIGGTTNSDWTEVAIETPTELNDRIEAQIDRVSYDNVNTDVTLDGNDETKHLIVDTSSPITISLPDDANYLDKDGNSATVPVGYQVILRKDDATTNALIVDTLGSAVIDSPAGNNTQPVQTTVPFGSLWVSYKGGGTWYVEGRIDGVS